MLKREAHAVWRHGPTEGQPALREAIAERFGVPAESVLVLAGAQQGLDLLARCLVDPGDAVIVDRPGYLGAIQSFRAAGAKLIGWDVARADMDELEDLLVRYRPKLIYTNPTFQNPTGVTMPIRARRELLKLAERYRVPIVEDATYRELYFTEAPPPSLRELDTQNIVIHLNSFSKVLAPGLRLGWLSAAPSIVDQIAIIKQRLDPHTQNLVQFAMARLIRDGSFDRHLRTLRAEHARRCSHDDRARSSATCRPARCGSRGRRAGCICGAASRRRSTPGAARTGARRRRRVRAGPRVLPGPGRRIRAAPVLLERAAGGDRRRGRRLARRPYSPGAPGVAADVLPAASHPTRVSSEPTIVDTAARRRACRERPATTRSASGTGPDSTPPSRSHVPGPSVLQRIERRIAAALERVANRGLDRGGADADAVEGAVVMAQQLEHRHRGADAGRAEVERQQRDVARPDGDRRRSDQDARVRRPAPGPSRLKYFRRIADDPDGEAAAGRAGGDIREDTRPGRVGERDQRPGAHRHRAAQLEDAQHVEESFRPSQVGHEERWRDRTAGCGNPPGVTHQRRARAAHPRDGADDGAAPAAPPTKK